MPGEPFDNMLLLSALLPLLGARRERTDLVVWYAFFDEIPHRRRKDDGDEFDLPVMREDAFKHINHRCGALLSVSP